MYKKYDFFNVTKEVVLLLNTLNLALTLTIILINCSLLKFYESFKTFTLCFPFR